VRNARHTYSVGGLTIGMVAWLALTPITQADPKQAAGSFADEDAVILVWEDSVALAADGGYTWRAKEHVRVQNDRANGTVADPRITYNKDFQSVTILTARTVCRDGRVVDVPAYSRNEVAPSETAGWPAFASIRQIVVSFSAVEPGAVLELEYEIASKPSSWPFVDFDFPIKASHPIVSREVLRNGKTIHKASNVESLIDEPLSLPVRDRGGFKVLSTSANTKAWAGAILEMIQGMAKPDDSMKSLVREWASGKTDPIDQAAAIQEKFAGQFTVVNLPSMTVAPRPRPAMQTWTSHYGSAMESAAVLLAMLRDAGLKAEPFFAVSCQSDDISIGAIAAYGVMVESRGETSYWHPMQGRVRNPGPWGGWRRYDRAFVADRSGVPAKFGAPLESRLEASARLTLNDSANYGGSVELRMTGLFLTNALRTEDQKKSAINEVLSRLLSNVELTTFSVATLSNDVFAVKAEVKSAKPLHSVGGDRVFSLPTDGPWMQAFALPLGKSGRKTLLKMPGPFAQECFIELKLPTGWSAAALPKSYGMALANDASMSQRVEAVGDFVKVWSSLNISQYLWSEEAYPELRSKLCETQSPAVRTLVLRKGDPAVSGK
jgi:Domain of Unknown Function with PDB structure (DUF3857)/Transglutaminase-like superfamily